MKNSIAYILLPLLLVLNPAFSQDNTVLTFEDYMKIVKSDHPLSKVADMRVMRGEAAMQGSRGNFDPELYYQSGNKVFDNSSYYDLNSAGLRIPTWLGIDVEGGLDRNSGDFLNPQNVIPEDGQYYAGVNIPLGEGLFMDKRRMEYRKAQIYMNATEYQRILLLNDLLLEAGSAYWDWFVAYKQLNVFEEALDLAQERFDAVVQGVELGDRRSMDTVEAGIQVRNRIILLRDARLKFTNASIQLSVYLWKEGQIPLELQDNTIPDTLSNEGQDNMSFSELDSLIASHPEMETARLKISGLDVERKWKREQIKPKLNLKYSLIAGQEQWQNNDWAINENRIWGLEFSMPIFLRRERGELRMTNIQLKEAQYQLEPKQANLKYKASAAINEVETTGSQIETARQMADDYLVLLQGERELFNAGESSLFLVNQRELGLINARIKLIELQGKNQIARLKSSYATGLLATE